MKKDNPINIENPAESTDVSRRSFFKVAGLGLGAGLVGGAVGCDGKPSGGGGWMPAQYEGRGTFPPQVRGRVPIDPLNLSICRDDSKCILCGQCSEVCDKTEAVMGHYELPMIDDTPCIHCGQCTLWCPTSSITETDNIAKVVAALKAAALKDKDKKDKDNDKYVIFQTAPSTRIALGEEFGMTVGSNVELRQVAAIRALGADYVFDTNFTADLTITEEASELVARLNPESKASIPLFTSCCPAWVKFCEYFYPELRPNLSTAKSPMGMLSALTKTYFAEVKGIDPKNIFNVAIMPCTAKKFEAARPDMNVQDDPTMRDTDAVLTTRELARLIKMKEIDWDGLEKVMYGTEGQYDKLLSQYSGAGAIFGATGGVMEAAVRTAYHYITNGETLPPLLYDLEPIRGLKGIKSAELKIPGVDDPVRVAVVSGMDNAKQLLDDMLDGSPKFGKFHFIEFMACPGGCISGGGQPKSSLPPSDKVRAARTETIYDIDKKIPLRLCHENPEIIALYDAYLEKHPNSHKAHHLLHVKENGYIDRSGNLVKK